MENSSNVNQLIQAAQEVRDTSGDFYFDPAPGESDRGLEKHLTALGKLQTALGNFATTKDELEKDSPEVKRYVIRHEHKYGEDEYHVESKLDLCAELADIESLDEDGVELLAQIETKCGIDFDPLCGEFLTVRPYEKPMQWVNLIE